MKRIQINIGDVFKVQLDSGKKYFQFIGLDLTQLNSEVIRAFTISYSSNDNLSVDDIVKGEIEFHAHTMIRLGYKMGLYEKVGNSKHDMTEQVTWRQATDSGNINRNQIYSDWLIWKTGKKMEKYTGKKQELRKTELGCVHNPIDVVERIRNGKYLYIHPRFE